MSTSHIRWLGEHLDVPVNRRAEPTVSLDVSAIGMTLRHYRRKHRLTIAALGGQLNRSPSYLSKIETGAFVPGPDTTRRLASELRRRARRDQAVRKVASGPPASDLDPRAHFAARLKDALARNEMSHQQLAAVLGVRPATVRMWTSGRRQPGLDHLIRLATALGQSIDGLVGVSAQAAPPDWLHADPDHDGGPLVFDVPGIVGPDGRPLQDGTRPYRRIQTVVRGVNDELIRRLAAAPHLVREIHWQDFEALVAELFARDGFMVEPTPRSGDGGVDLYAARRTGLGSLLYVVQCKQWAEDRPVGPDAVLALKGALDRDRASAGLIATTSSFTPSAQREQRELEWRVSLQAFADIKRWLLGGPIFAADDETRPSDLAERLSALPRRRAVA